MNVDYIIVGQGLAGSALAMECLKRGKRIVVFDEPANNKASVVAAGICNPVTGKAMSKTFLAEQIFPFLSNWYADTEKALGEKFFQPLPVYRPFLTPYEYKPWLEKSSDELWSPFIQEVRETPFLPGHLNNPHGGLMIRQSGVLDVKRWLLSVRALLRAGGMFREAHIDENEIKSGDGVTLGDIQGSKIIFCDGLAAADGKWFGWLPLRKLKGETITVRADFPDDTIISRGIYLVPSCTPGFFLTGSTYQHEPFTEGASADGRAHLADRLKAWLRTPFEIVHHDWGIRPAVIDRRPLLGPHPEAGNVIIFNGLGTKGVSLAPWLASVLVDWMETGLVLPETVNISRFKSLYSN